MQLEYIRMAAEELTAYLRYLLQLEPDTPDAWQDLSREAKMAWFGHPGAADFLRRQEDWVDMLLPWRIDYYLRGLPKDASKPCVDQLLEEDRAAALLLVKLAPEAFLGEASCVAAALQDLKQEPGEASSGSVVKAMSSPPSTGLQALKAESAVPAAGPARSSPDFVKEVMIKQEILSDPEEEEMLCDRQASLGLHRVASLMRLCMVVACAHVFICDHKPFKAKQRRMQPPPPADAVVPAAAAVAVEGENEEEEVLEANPKREADDARGGREGQEIWGALPEGVSS